MKRDIIINATDSEIRVALLEEGRLAEIFIETPDKENPVGAIYLGKVKRVAQGMNAAFINIGDSQDAFLHFSDAANASADLDTGEDDEDEIIPSTTPNLQSRNQKTNPKKNTKNNNSYSKGTQVQTNSAEQNSKLKVENREANNKNPNQKLGDRKNEKQKNGRYNNDKPQLESQIENRTSGKPSSVNQSSGNADSNKPHQKTNKKQIKNGLANQQANQQSINQQGDKKSKGVKSDMANVNVPNKQSQKANLEVNANTANIVRQTNIFEENLSSKNILKKTELSKEGDNFNKRRTNNQKKIAPKEIIEDSPQKVNNETDRKNKTGQASKSENLAKKKNNQPDDKNKNTGLESTKSEPENLGGKTLKKKNNPVEINSQQNSSQNEVKVDINKQKTKRAQTEKPKNISLSEPNKNSANKQEATTKKTEDKLEKKTESKSTVRAKKSKVKDNKLPFFQTKRSGTVTIDLTKNQEILVQVIRERYAQKGMRVTTKLALPGRFLVLLPLEPVIGVSKKIESYAERRRLRRIAREILPDGYGCIIRTVAKEQNEEIIREELSHLLERWQAIEEKIKKSPNPSLIYTESSLVASIMRDLFTENINRVVIDNQKVYDEIFDYVSWAAPDMIKKIELYKQKQPIYEAFGVERELGRIFHRKIFLKSGGYLILEQTEAMMVVDVNSGRYKGSSEQEINALYTNLEAAREITRQLRLRDVGGLVAIDFIDMLDEKNKRKVFEEIRRELQKDRAKAVVLPMSQFCIIQVTRQRIRNQVVNVISEPCRSCEGRGFVHSKPMIMKRIEQWLYDFKSMSKEFRLSLAVNPAMIDFVTEGTISRLTKLMMKNFVRIKLIPDESLPIEEFRFFSHRLGVDITDSMAAA